VPRYCTVLEDGRPVRIDYQENDHCCERFALADEWLRVRGLQSEGRVGHAYARLAAARDIVSVTLEHLAQDPLRFLHPPSARCAECDEARKITVA
jgi:aminoglycoside 3-N-acetyltransferase-4